MQTIKLIFNQSDERKQKKRDYELVTNQSQKQSIKVVLNNNNNCY